MMLRTNNYASVSVNSKLERATSGVFSQQIGVHS